MIKVLLGFFPLKKKFHWLNPPLLRRNTGVLINLLHQAAGSDFLLYKSLQMIFTHNQLIFYVSKYKK